MRAVTKTALFDSNRAISAMKWHRHMPLLGRSGIDFQKRRRATDGAPASLACLLAPRSLAGGVQAIAAAARVVQQRVEALLDVPEHLVGVVLGARARLAFELAGVGHDGFGLLL